MYGIKYKIQFADHFENTWLVNLLQNNYSGAQIALTCSGDPLRFSCEGSDNDRFTSIRAKYATLRIISAAYQTYFELFDTNSEPFQAKIYKGGQLYFWGTVLPEEYSEKVINSPHVVELTIIDGLSLLKNKEFVPKYERGGVLYEFETNPVTGGLITPMAIIRTCLSFIDFGLDLDILENAQIYHTDGNEATSPLRQKYLNPAAFRDSNGYFSCYTVLNMVLQSECLRITQGYVAGSGLVWLLESIDTLKDEHTLRLHDKTTGTENGTVSLNPILALTNAQGSPLNVFTDHSANVMVDQAPCKLTIASNSGHANNLIKDPYNYNRNADGVIEHRDDDVLIIQPKPVGTFIGYNGNVIFNLGFIKPDCKLFQSNGKFVFTHRGDSYISVSLMMYIDGSNFTAVFNNGKWYFNEFFVPTYKARPTTAETTYTVAVTHVIEGLLQNILDTNSLELQGRAVLIVRCEGYKSGREWHWGVQQINLDSLYVSLCEDASTQYDGKNLSGVLSGSGTEKIVSLDFTNALKGYRSRAQSAIQGIEGAYYPGYAFSNLVYRYEYPKVKLAGLFKRYNRAESISLIQIQYYIYHAVYSINRIQLSGTILGQFDLHNTIYTSLDGRLYIVDQWEYNVKRGIHTVTLLEIAKGYNLLLETEDGNNLIITEDGNNIEV